jgi:hypothetical protein
MQFRIAFANLSVALALLALPATAQQSQPQSQRGGVAQTGIAKLPFADKPQRSNDQEQETLALQLVDSLALACRGTEMYRWRFAEEDPDRAQTIVASAEKGLKDKGYAVSPLPVEVDTVVALMARHPNRAQADPTVLTLWYVGEQGVDLTVCRVREK